MKLLGGFFGPPSRERFAEMVMQQLKENGLEDACDFDPEEFRLVFSDSRTLNLANFYDAHCKLPRAERKAHLQEMASVTPKALEDVRLPDRLEDAGHNLRPRLWTRGIFQFLNLKRQLQPDAPSPEIAGYPIGDHLFCSVVYDLPEFLRTLSLEDLKRWGVTVNEALEVGCRRLDENTASYAKIGDGTYSFTTGDTYDASRLVLVDRIRKLSVAGDHVAIVPNRECLMITGSDDEEGLGILASFAEKVSADAYPLIPMPLRLEGESWVDWMPGRDQPCYPRFHRLITGFLQEMYGQQQQLLDQIHESEGRDIFVASLTAAEHENGELFSYSVWSDGVDTLLPRTDVIILFREGEKVLASGTWDRVTSIVSDLLEPVGELYPVRFRVRGFPDAEQLARIGKI